MKHRIPILIAIISISFIAFTSLGSPAHASTFSSEYYDSEDFDVHFHSQERAQKDYENIGFSVQTNTDSVPNTEAIYSFAVSESGYVAVGLVSYEILIFSPQGQLLRCFCFDADGNYGLAFFRDTLGIAFINTMLTVTLDGELVNSSETDYRAGASFLEKTQGRYRETITVGDTTYRLKNDFGKIQGITGRYGALVKVDAEGNEEYLYDARISHNIHSVLMGGGFVVLFVGGHIFLIVKVVRSFRKRSLKSKREMPAIYTAAFWK